MPRKGENITKRKDGRWEARIIKGYDCKGKAQYAYLYDRSYSEAKGKKLHLFVNQMKKRNKTVKCYSTPFCQNSFYIIKTNLKNQPFRSIKGL